MAPELESREGESSVREAGVSVCGDVLVKMGVGMWGSAGMLVEGM